jgi:hypothetical protein
MTKARDPRHASAMFERAKMEMNRAGEESRESRWLAINWSSHDNPTISEEALADITKDMTMLSYRQEIMAEDATEVPGALWKQAWIDDTRIDASQVPDLEMVVIGVDPSGSTTTEAGIVAAGSGPAPLNWIPSDEILKIAPNVTALPHIYVLNDSSLSAPTPIVWAQAAVNLYFERKADRLLGERNYGGDMVESTIRQAQNGQAVSYLDANATRGKVVRAEPVAAAYQRGIVHHVGVFPELENEQCSYVPGGKSPNRMDACVWCGLLLLEGLGVLGLLDYFKQGHAQDDLNKLDKTSTASTLGKVIIADAAPDCPECGSQLLQTIGGGQQRCGQCGIQFAPKGMKPKANGQGQSRGAYLADADARRR